jgi:single stranded DNA-binding protein
MASEQEQLNNVTLLGYLQDDAELRFTANGGRIAQATLKCYNGKDKNGEKNKPQWWKLKSFGQNAENMGALRKGAKIQIHRANLRVDYWQSREGQNRQTPYLEVWEFEVLEPGDANDGYTEYTDF